MASMLIILADIQCFYGEINMTVVWRWRNLLSNREEMSKYEISFHSNVR